ncbi:MAG: hypothetical protein H6576_03485 [Lewinellaceae bacterium]|nr:hypothetical protein [Saprospiraceae bacterium]MCB9342728.1 hypothetical protein [Lewinellaceae bacterium]
MHKTSLTYRITALLLAFSMFFSSKGFLVDMHYCRGTLKSVSFIGKARNCHDLARAASHHKSGCRHHQKVVQKSSGCADDKNCCSNKTVHIQSDQDQQAPGYADLALSISFQPFVLYSPPTLSLGGLTPDRETLIFEHYKPPLIPRDIPVLMQSFLI